MWTQQLFHLKPTTLRNAAHLHVIHKLIVIDKLSKEQTQQTLNITTRTEGNDEETTEGCVSVRKRKHSSCFKHDPIRVVSFNSITKDCWVGEYCCHKAPNGYWRPC